MGNNSVPKFIFRLSRFPVYRGSVLGRFCCTKLGTGCKESVGERISGVVLKFFPAVGWGVRIIVTNFRQCSWPVARFQPATSGKKEAFVQTGVRRRSVIGGDDY